MELIIKVLEDGPNPNPGGAIVLSHTSTTRWMIYA